ncbi:MAG: MurR/RpiR family transcriptional regulator [Spirochaetia bacterium]|nr:MurR/RpiR family transcriptional regulator [Spirochaetia bacterium]MCF7946732.1 MurR/RpiR family transcriptional regulator [Spirochaetia bacterium]
MNRIRKLEGITDSEEKVLRFLEENYPLIAFETIHSISKKCSVGKATVTRFVTRLGYKSFSDFMNSIRKEVSSQLETPIDRFSNIYQNISQAPETHYNMHAETSMRNIEITRNRIDPAAFNQAVDILAKTSGKLYITGAATSYGLAYFFYMLATYMRSNVVLLETSPASLSHKLIDVQKEDTLLSILHYRFSNQTVKAAKWFSECGASIVLISDRMLTPISSIATVQLYSSSDGPEMFNSRLSTMFILETLLSSMAARLETNVYERFELFENLRSRFNVFSAQAQIFTQPKDQNSAQSQHISKTKSSRNESDRENSNNKEN